MLRAACLTVVLTGFAAAQEPGAAVAYTRHDGHFYKNPTKIAGGKASMVCADKEHFDTVFGSAATMGKKPNFVTADTFKQKLVVGFVTLADAVTTYTVEDVNLAKGTATVRFKSESGKAGTARYASPLILSIDRAGVKEVVFVENGKRVSAEAVSPPPSAPTTKGT